ncbi:MAG: hypothetical protein ACR2JG_14865 [Geodermatophilaceae bacterium]
MRLPMPRSIPGPADLLDAVAAVGNGVGDALELVPRMGTLLDQAEALLGRVGRVVDRIESTMDRADILISGVTATDQAARELVGSVEDTAARAGTLLELYDDPLRTLAPSLRTFAERLDRTEVEALIQLVDRLPLLLKHLDEDIFPILTTLDRVAPDLHQLLDIAQDLQVALGGVPGMGWLRKKADKEEEEAQREAREIEAVTGKTAGKPKR